MDDPGCAPFYLSRDSHLPMDPMEMSCFDIRAHATSSRRAHDTKVASTKRSRASRSGNTAPSPPHISLPAFNAGAYWIASAQGNKRSRLYSMQQLKDGRNQHDDDALLDRHLHHSTCLNLSPDATTSDADLWILPDFDDWALSDESTPSSPPPQQQQAQASAAASSQITGYWAPLVRRAVVSNRERLRRRLEGDGWDFVGGRYGEVKERGETGEELVDEEFDVVVLPVLRATC